MPYSWLAWPFFVRLRRKVKALKKIIVPRYGIHNALGTKPKVYTPKQYTTTQSRNKKNNPTVNNSSRLNAAPTEKLDIDIKELYKSYSKLNLLVDNLTEWIKTLEEENASMKLLLNVNEANVWQNCSRTIKIRDIPSPPNFISASKFSPLQQLQIDDTQISHTS